MNTFNHYNLDRLTSDKAQTRVSRRDNAQQKPIDPRIPTSPAHFIELTTSPFCRDFGRVTWSGAIYGRWEGPGFAIDVSGDDRAVLASMWTPKTGWTHQAPQQWDTDAMDLPATPGGFRHSRTPE